MNSLEISRIKKSKGNRLTSCRRDMGVLQADLSNKVGVDNTTLSRWENGGMPFFKIRAALRLLDELGLDHRAFFDLPEK